MVVVWADSPVLRHVVFVGIVFLVVGEEIVELDRLLEVFNGLETSDVLEEVEVAEDVDSSSDKSLPVNGLELNIGVVLLELEGNGLAEVNVWSLDRVHVFTGHLELRHFEVLWEHLHFIVLINLINYNTCH